MISLFFICEIITILAYKVIKNFSKSQILKIRNKIHNMKFSLKIEDLGKIESKHSADRNMYHLTFKTYNASIEGKFEKSEIRHMIQILDNAVV